MGCLRLCMLALLPWVLSARAWDPERILLAAQRYGPTAVQGVRDLQSAMAAVKGRSEAVQVEAVNTFFDQHIIFQDDLTNWGQVDYWASPLEALSHGRGDCEDYAIAKYFTLVAMGVPDQKLRMVYVRAQIGGPGGPSEAHMVLAYYPRADAEPLVLDNLVNEVLPASRRSDLTPVFSFNAEGIWQGVGAAAAGGKPLERLSRWRDVVEKSRRDGFY